MIFLFLIPPIISGNVFDNTALMVPKDPQPNQLQPCTTVRTEHLSQLSGDYSQGRLALHSSRIIHEIVTHLLFILPLEKNIYYSDSQEQFITFVSFQETFQYTPMALPADYVRACHPVLFLKQKDSFLCKNTTMIKFNLIDCAAMLQTSVQLVIPVNEELLKPLSEGIILHATKQLGGPILFHDINKREITCVGIVAQPYLNILNNILISSAAVFHHYELVLSSLFPNPECPNMVFNIPSDYFSIYFDKFPRILAVILENYVLTPMICVQLLHNKDSRTNRGSGSLDNLFQWVFGDTPKRVYDLETIEMKHLVKINRLIDQSVETSLSIDKNAKELSDILSYVRND